MATLTFKVALQRLHDVNELVQSQIAAGMDTTEILSSKFTSFCATFDALNSLTGHQIGELTKASNNGPWTQEQKLELARLFDGKGELDTQSSGKKALKRAANQKCTAFENFIPEDKWIMLKREKTQTTTRQHILADVASSINITNPDQPTLYRIVAILAYCERNVTFSQKNVFDAMDRIQANIKNAKKHKDMPYVEVYPCMADQLPDQIKSHAYPEGLPVVVDIAELDHILGSAKMRGRQDIPEHMAWMKDVPEHLMPAVLETVRKQGLAEATHMSQHRSEPMPNYQPLSSMDLRARSRRFAVPQHPSFGTLAPRASPSSHVDSEHVKDEPDDDAFGVANVLDIEEYKATIKEELKKKLEAEMKAQFIMVKKQTDLVENDNEDKCTHGTIGDLEDAMKARLSPKDKKKMIAAEKKASKQKIDAEKRAKKAEENAAIQKAKEDAKTAKVAAKAAPKTKAKAKSANKVMKRPAMDVDSVKIPPKIMKITMTDVFNKLKGRRRELNYKIFTNIASDYGYKRAKNEGAEYEVYRAFARVQYKKASAMWHDTA